MPPRPPVTRYTPPSRRRVGRPDLGFNFRGWKPCTHRRFRRYATTGSEHPPSSYATNRLTDAPVQAPGGAVSTSMLAQAIAGFSFGVTLQGPIAVAFHGRIMS